MASDSLAGRRKRGGKKKNFIQGAIKHPGALTAQAMMEGESPMEYAQEHMHDSGTTGKRSRLALTLRKLSKRKKRG